MLQRFVVGIVKGLSLGALVAVALVAGLGVQNLVGWLAYPIVAVLGVLTALVAGKPFWAKGALVEVALKSVAGAIVATILWFVIGRYVSMPLDLGGLGSGRVSTLPWVMMPTIATLLAVFFEIDNDTSDEGVTPLDHTKRRVADSNESLPEVEFDDEHEDSVTRREL